MEVSVAGINLPQDTIISIRLGDTRRQACLGKLANQPLRFPCPPSAGAAGGAEAGFGESSDGDNLLRVEVLKVVTAQRVALRPTEESYRVDLAPCESSNAAAFGSFESDAALSLTVKWPEDNVAPLAPNAREYEIDENEAEYLERHSLLNHFQGLLHDVLAEKPEDPLTFLKEQLDTIQQRACQFSSQASDGLAGAGPVASSQARLPKADTRGQNAPPRPPKLPSVVMSQYDSRCSTALGSSSVFAAATEKSELTLAELRRASAILQEDNAIMQSCVKDMCEMMERLRKENVELSSRIGFAPASAMPAA